MRSLSRSGKTCPMMAGLSLSKRDSGYKEDFIMRKGVESPEPGKIIIINGPSSAGPPPCPAPSNSNFVNAGGLWGDRNAGIK